MTTHDERARAEAIPRALWEAMTVSAVLYGACARYVQGDDPQPAFAAGYEALVRQCEGRVAMALRYGRPVAVGTLPPWPTEDDPRAMVSPAQVEALLAAHARSEALGAVAERAAAVWCGPMRMTVDGWEVERCKGR